MVNSIDMVRRIEKVKRWNCYFCDTEIEKSDDGFFAPIDVITKKGFILVTIVAQVCSVCHAYEAAILEAKDDSRRFTEITISGCVCGAVALSKTLRCVRCWREARMLEKQEANVRFNRNLIQQLKGVLNGKDKYYGRTS